MHACALRGGELVKPADTVRVRQRFRQVVARAVERVEKEIAEETAALRPVVDGRGRRKRPARRGPEEADD